MMRKARWLAGAVVLAAVLPVLAQEGGGPKTTEYYPLKKGNKWVYVVQGNTIELRVTGFEKVGDQMCAKLETFINDKATQSSEMIGVKDDGVYRYQVNGVKPDQPIKILALPPKKDDKWTVDTKIQNQAIKGTFVVKEEKGVKVPAGQFDTFLVDGSDFEIAGQKSAIKYWFAKDKGVVKLSFTLDRNEAVLELKEFEPAKQ